MRYYLNRYFYFDTAPKFSNYRSWMLCRRNHLQHKDCTDIAHWIPCGGGLSDEAHVRRDKPFKRRV